MASFSTCSSTGESPSDHETKNFVCDDQSWWSGVYEAADLLPESHISCDQSSTKSRNLSGGLTTAGNLVCRKRPIYPAHQKIAAAKLSLNSGTGHVNYAGKFRNARKLKPTCNDNCNRCDRPKLNHAEREYILNTFWSLSDHERQWLYIFGLVKTTAPRKKTSVNGGKQSTRTYFFSLHGQHRRVCKTMFTSTLCICDSWIDSSLSHFSGNGYKPDMRGKHHRGKKQV